MMSSLTGLKAVIEPTEVFLDESNRTQFKRFISDKMTMVDKNAVEIAVTLAKGMPMSSFKITAELEAGQKTEMERQDELILKAFKKKNAEHVALIGREYG